MKHMYLGRYILFLNHIKSKKIPYNKLLNGDLFEYTFFLNTLPYIGCNLHGEIGVKQVI